MEKPFYENKSAPYEIHNDRLLCLYPHLHKELEIIYVIEGKSVAHADRNCYVIEKGDLFISFPNQIHYYENSVAGNYAIIIFSPDIVLGLKHKFKSFTPKNNVIKFSENSQIKDYINHIINAKGEYKDTQISGYINLTVSEIMQKIELKPRIQSENSSLKDILNYCSEHYTDDITLNDVADNLHLSKYYVSRLLNQKLTLSFNDYINNLRVNAACDMLTETDKKIADISEDVGFGTIRSFNRAFLRLRNMTPIQYRELVNI